MTVEELEIIIRANISDAISGIKQITNEVRNAVSKSVEPMKEMTSQAKTLANSSASSISKMKNQLNGYNSAINETTKQQAYLKSRIEDLQDKLKMADLGYEVGDTMKIEADIEKLTNQLNKLQLKTQATGQEMTTTFGKIKAGIKNAITHFSGISKKMKTVLSNSKELGKGFANTFNNGISSIKKFALALLSVRTAFSLISKAMSSYLSYDTQLADSLQNCWNVLGSLLAPILERLIALFSTLVSYVNAFVKALTGVDLVARANTKSLNKQAKASKNASNAQKQLSGLDDLNNLTTSSGGGGGDDSNPITVGDVDLSKLDKVFSWLDKLKEVMLKIFDPIKQAWDSKGEALIESIKKAFEGIKNLGIAVFSSIFEVWTNGTGQKIVENILEMWTKVFNIIGAFSQALANAWNNAGNGTAIIQSIADIFIAIQDIIISIADSLQTWVMSEEFQSALNVVFGIVSDLFGYVQQICTWIASMYKTYLAPVVDKILECISKIIIAIGAIWDFLSPIIDTIISVIMTVLEPVIEGLCGIIGGIIDALSGVMDFITGVFTGDWEKAWNGIKEFIGGIVSAIGSLFKGLFDTIVALFKGAWDIIKSIWSVVSTWFNNNIIQPLAKLFTGIWNTMKTGASNAWNGIKSVFSSVATFFKNIFTNAWTAVKNVFSTGGKIFSGIKDGIFNAFKAVVNTLIAGINKIVAIPFNAINKALKTVRDISFLGIAPFKGLISLINVPQIPSLAKGGILTEETLVRVAEYSNAQSNPEIVSPVNMMKDSFRDVLEESDFGGTRIDRLTLKVLDETVFDDAIEYINEKSRIKGVSVIKGVG